MSWKLVILFRGAVFRHLPSFTNKHSVSVSTRADFSVNVDVSEMIYDIVSLNTTMLGIQQGCCLTLPSQIHLNLVLWSKLKQTLRYRSVCENRWCDHLSKHATSSATLLCPHSSQSKYFPWLFKKHVKLLIFIKYAFLKPTPTSFLPEEELTLNRERALACSTT